MPPIRSATVGPNALTVLTMVDHLGTHSLSVAQIPDTSTIAAVEAWVNGTWVPANIPDYQLVVKVTSLSPLRVAVWCGGPNAVNPVNAIL